MWPWKSRRPLEDVATDAVALAQFLKERAERAEAALKAQAERDADTRLGELLCAACATLEREGAFQCPLEAMNAPMRDLKDWWVVNKGEYAAQMERKRISRHAARLEVMRKMTRDEAVLVGKAELWDEANQTVPA